MQNTRPVPGAWKGVRFRPEDPRGPTVQQLIDHQARGRKLIVGSNFPMESGYHIPLGDGDAALIVGKRTTREEFITHLVEAQTDPAHVPYYYEVELEQ